MPTSSSHGMDHYAPSSVPRSRDGGGGGGGDYYDGGGYRSSRAGDGSHWGYQRPPSRR